MIWFGGELCTNFAGNILRVEQNQIISNFPSDSCWYFPAPAGSLGLWEQPWTTTAGKTPRNHYFTSFLVYQKQKSIFQPKSISAAKPTSVTGNNWFSFLYFSHWLVSVEIINLHCQTYLNIFTRALINCLAVIIISDQLEGFPPWPYRSQLTFYKGFFNLGKIFPEILPRLSVEVI